MPADSARHRERASSNRSPEDVHDLVQLGTAGYLIAHPLPAGEVPKLLAYLKSADAMLTTDHPDLATAKAMLVTQVPPQWRGIAAAGSGLIARRVHIENLVESGQTKLAAEYLRAAILGVVDAMALSATPAGFILAAR